MKINALVALVAWAIGGFCGWLLFQCQPVDPKLIAEIDTVLVQADTIGKRLDSTIAGSQASARAIARFRADARIAQDLALNEKLRADSLATIAHDTAAAYLARSIQAAQLDSALRKTDSALTEATDRLAKVEPDLVTARNEIAVLTKKLTRARDALKKAGGWDKVGVFAEGESNLALRDFAVRAGAFIAPTRRVQVQVFHQQELRRGDGSSGDFRAGARITF